MKKKMLITLGTLALVLGAIGIFIPLLPTTPFLLLASWCYLKSSRSLYDWVLNHRVFGFYVKSYIQYRAIEKNQKRGALLLLWTTILLSMKISSAFWIRILLLIIALGVTTHLMLLKTLTKEQLLELEKSQQMEFTSNQEV